MLLAEIDRQVYYLPITVVFGAVLIAWKRLCRWAHRFPHGDELERSMLERARRNEALARTEQMQKARLR